LYASYTICKLDVVTHLIQQGGNLSTQSPNLHVTKQRNYIERYKKCVLLEDTLFYVVGLRFAIAMTKENTELL
jgi:hypothetical protein